MCLEAQFTPDTAVGVGLQGLWGNKRPVIYLRVGGTIYHCGPLTPKMSPEKFMELLSKVVDKPFVMLDD